MPGTGRLKPEITGKEPNVKQVILGIVAAAMMVVIAGGVAEAKGPKGPGGSSEVLTVAPLAAAASPSGIGPVLGAGGELYALRGAGFGADQPVYITFREPFCCAATTVMVDGGGTFEIVRDTKTPGTYTIDAMAKRAGKLVTVATVNFEVVAN